MVVLGCQSILNFFSPSASPSSSPSSSTCPLTSRSCRAAAAASRSRIIFRAVAKGPGHCSSGSPATQPKYTSTGFSAMHFEKYRMVVSVCGPHVAYLRALPCAPRVRAWLTWPTALHRLPRPVGSSHARSRRHVQSGQHGTGPRDAWHLGGSVSGSTVWSLSSRPPHLQLCPLLPRPVPAPASASCHCGSSTVVPQKGLHSECHTANTRLSIACLWPRPCWLTGPTRGAWRGRRRL